MESCTELQKYSDGPGGGGRAGVGVEGGLLQELDAGGGGGRSENIKREDLQTNPG